VMQNTDREQFDSKTGCRSKHHSSPPSRTNSFDLATCWWAQD
jgi:hypothetical protein